MVREHTRARKPYPSPASKYTIHRSEFPLPSIQADRRIRTDVGFGASRSQVRSGEEGRRVVHSQTQIDTNCSRCDRASDDDDDDDDEHAQLLLCADRCSAVSLSMARDNIACLCWRRSGWHQTHPPPLSTGRHSTAHAPPPPPLVATCK